MTLMKPGCDSNATWNRPKNVNFTGTNYKFVPDFHNMIKNKNYSQLDF